MQTILWKERWLQMSNYMMRNHPAQMQRSCTQGCQQRTASPAPDSCQMPRRMEERRQTSGTAMENCRMTAGAGTENCRMDGGNRRRTSFETMNQTQLLDCINEVSFAVSDILLYLDTHPDDCAALSYSREMIAARREAMAVYARRFAPLTIDSTNDADSCRWEWVMQPWPWEPAMKGGCR
ncbi:hypothetical protein BRYFOR_08815 [Marvinbryantia formatexigens DSM 14469]|uniref:Protein CotJB domain-containing protein n=2 Tax=Marvinbryantia TaxID=248744 RepID=C6LJH9_9FIRM|nr:hypothetical protein BRYFOR_08815 [Marvinbryantia formatexigens DSM 14469]